MQSRRRNEGPEFPGPRVPRRSQAGLVLSAAIIVLAGFGVALVAMGIETYRWPRSSIWGVIGVTVLLVAVIRTVSTRKPRAGR